MKIIERLKEVNRTLLEMYIGIVFWGMVCWLVGMFLAKDQGFFSRSLWFGICFALLNTRHLYRSLDRALSAGDMAGKMIGRSYSVRYASVILVFGAIMATRVMDVLVVFLAYMGMKVAAFIQPFTHKLCNKLFHETDPIPEAMPEEEFEEEEFEEQSSIE